MNRMKADVEKKRKIIMVKTGRKYQNSIADQFPQC